MISNCLICVIKRENYIEGNEHKKKIDIRKKFIDSPENDSRFYINYLGWLLHSHERTAY